MKIVNGSPNMMQLQEISVGLTEIRLGPDTRAYAAVGTMMVGFTLPFFDSLPGSWYHYWILFTILGFGWMFTNDARKAYQPDMIDKLFIGDISRIAVKEGSGSLSLGGAAVGGLIFGGAGAIVGAIAGGNSSNDTVQEFETATLKFNNNEWAVVVAKDWAEKLEMKNLMKMAGCKNACPI